MVRWQASTGSMSHRVLRRISKASQRIILFGKEPHLEFCLFVSGRFSVKRGVEQSPVYVFNQSALPFILKICLVCIIISPRDLLNLRFGFSGIYPEEKTYGKKKLTIPLILPITFYTSTATSNTCSTTSNSSTTAETTSIPIALM